MQQGGAGQRGVEAAFEELEQHTAHFDDVRDVGLPGFASLLLVRGGREIEGRPHAPGIHPRRSSLRLGQEGGAQLGVERGGHSILRALTLSWMRGSPIHSLTCGTNAMAQRPARASSSACSPE